MMDRIEHVLRGNRGFVVAQLGLAEHNGQLAERRYPHCLWIDCPRGGAAPARAIEFGPQRGGFVHRHVAMLASQADARLPAIVRYAVQVQKVNHIIVCGHYGGDDTRATSGPAPYELFDHWLRVQQDTERYFWKELAPLHGEARRNRLIELCVLDQMHDLGETDIVRRAWRHRGRPTLHGWVVDPLTGYLHMQTRMLNNDDAMRVASLARSPASSH